MNERLLELAHQAKIEFTYDPTETPMRAFAECWEDELQKFAELVVKECANAFETEVDTWKEMSPYQGSIKRQGTKAIKQHFGVE